MKISKVNLLLVLSSLILLTGCSPKIVPAPCPSIVTLSKVDEEEITTNSDGGLDENNTIKAFMLIARLREVERYYRGETISLSDYVRERNKKVNDG